MTSIEGISLKNERLPSCALLRGPKEAPCEAFRSASPRLHLRPPTTKGLHPSSLLGQKAGVRTGRELLQLPSGSVFRLKGPPHSVVSLLFVFGLECASEAVPGCRFCHPHHFSATFLF